MSVGAVSEEGVGSVSPFDGEIEFKDKANEKITGLANKLLHFHSYLRQSYRMSWSQRHLSEYGQSSTWLQESVRRICRALLFFPFWMGLSPIAGAAAIVTTIGNLSHNCLYRTIRGTFNGEMNKTPKLFLLNPRMLTGVNPQKNVGVSIASDRFDRLVSTIKDNNPDVVFLPEVSRFTAPYLADSLTEDYHFFFSGMGERIIGEDTSFFIAFRGTLVEPPEYVPFKNQSWLMGAGYFVMKTEERIYICTYHPTHEGWNEIFSREFGDKRQIVLMGEMEPQDKSIETFPIQKGFVSGIPENTQTTTSAPYRHYYRTEEEKITSLPFLYFRKMEGKTNVVPMHEPKKIAEALSDHALILHR